MESFEEKEKDMIVRACQLSLILAAVTAAPAALAGSDINKCVDRVGHITLTDQACPPGTAGQRMVLQEGYSGTGGSTGSGGPEDEPGRPIGAPAVEHFPAPPTLAPQHRWRPAPAVKKPKMSRDAATLKAARMQLLLLDSERARHGGLAKLD
jgi:hypothetical protein